MNLNELALHGYLKTTPHTGPEKSVLVIDIKKEKEKPDLVKTYRLNTDTKTTIEDVLYELRELEQLTQMELENGIQQRLQQEKKALESSETSDKLPEMRKKPLNGGLKPQIIERRIPSFYGSDNRLGSETLVIDDVRQSAMLDIDGVTHILKNECLIDGDSVDQLNRLGSSADSSSSKKLNNRTVIVVEDQLINNGAKSLKLRNGKNETLKIDVKSKKAASTLQLSNSVGLQSSPLSDYEKTNSSNEFLTNSERAQYERVDLKPIKNNKIDYFVSLRVVFYFQFFFNSTVMYQRISGLLLK